MTRSAHRGAVFDIGTNTVRVLQADKTPDGFLELVRDHRVVRLGQGVSASGRFHVDALARTLNGLQELRDLCGDIDRVDAVATSATRDASNREEFLGPAAEILGVRPRVISGDEEARLSFSGATSANDFDAPLTVIDVGGGSTEFVYGHEFVEYAVSLDMGSVRLTEDKLGEKPVTQQKVEEANRWLEGTLKELALPDQPTTVIGVAGTFTALGAIDLGLDVYDRSKVHGHRMSLARLRDLTRWLGSLTLDQTAQIPSLPVERAEVLFGGALVATAAVAATGTDSLVISENDLLDGLLSVLLND